MQLKHCTQHRNEQVSIWYVVQQLHIHKSVCGVGGGDHIFSNFSPSTKLEKHKIILHYALKKKWRSIQHFITFVSCFPTYRIRCCYTWDRFNLVTRQRTSFLFHTEVFITKIGWFSCDVTQTRGHLPQHCLSHATPLVFCH